MPGVCGVGAQTAQAGSWFGAGEMLCFVSPGDEYILAYIATGEGVVGSGSRSGGNTLGSAGWRQLSEAEAERCRALSDLLEKVDGGAPDAGTAEATYVRCPQP